MLYPLSYEGGAFQESVADKPSDRCSPVREQLTEVLACGCTMSRVADSRLLSVVLSAKRC